MALSTDVKLVKSQTVTYTPANGGLMSTVEAQDSVDNNFIPAISSAQRASGANVKRKGFFHNRAANDSAILTAKVGLSDISSGADVIHLIESTQSDTDNDLTGSEDKYGVGRLNGDVIATATSIVVNSELGAGADLSFKVGYTIKISDGVNSEFAEIDTGGVSIATDQYTLTLTAGLAYGYLAATPTVISACVVGNLETSYTGFVVNSGASGTYDDTTYPIGLNNRGTIEQTWIATFSSATAFTVVGNTVGSVGSGVIGADFSPTNAFFSQKYFTLLSAGFGGTFQTGDTITWVTHPSSIPFRAVQVIPAAMSAVANAITSGFFLNFD